MATYSFVEPQINQLGRTREIQSLSYAFATTNGNCKRGDLLVSSSNPPFTTIMFPAGGPPPTNIHANIIGFAEFGNLSTYAGGTAGTAAAPGLLGTTTAGTALMPGEPANVHVTDVRGDQEYIMSLNEAWITGAHTIKIGSQVGISQDNTTKFFVLDGGAANAAVIVLGLAQDVNNYQSGDIGVRLIVTFLDSVLALSA